MKSRGGCAVQPGLSKTETTGREAAHDDGRSWCHISSCQRCLKATGLAQTCGMKELCTRAPARDGLAPAEAAKKTTFHCSGGRETARDSISLAEVCAQERQQCGATSRLGWWRAMTLLGGDDVMFWGAEAIGWLFLGDERRLQPHGLVYLLEGRLNIAFGWCFPLCATTALKKDSKKIQARTIGKVISL